MFTTEETTFADIDFFFSFLRVLFSKKIISDIVEENNPSEKSVTEELHGFDIDDIGKLEDLLRIY